MSPAAGCWRSEELVGSGANVPWVYPLCVPLTAMTAPSNIFAIVVRS